MSISTSLSKEPFRLFQTCQRTEGLVDPADRSIEATLKSSFRARDTP